MRFKIYSVIGLIIILIFVGYITINSTIYTNLVNKFGLSTINNNITVENSAPNPVKEEESLLLPLGSNQSKNKSKNTEYSTSSNKNIKVLLVGHGYYNESQAEARGLFYIASNGSYNLYGSKTLLDHNDKNYWLPESTQAEIGDSDDILNWPIVYSSTSLPIATSSFNFTFEPDSKLIYNGHSFAWNSTCSEWMRKRVIICDTFKSYYDLTTLKKLDSLSEFKLLPNNLIYYQNMRGMYIGHPDLSIISTLVNFSPYTRCEYGIDYNDWNNVSSNMKDNFKISVYNLKEPEKSKNITIDINTGTSSFTYFSIEQIVSLKEKLNLVQSQGEIYGVSFCSIGVY